MTEHGPGPAGEYGRQPAAAVPDGRMTDRVDVGVDLVQAAGVAATTDRLPGQAQLEQL
jgi:hypothetical protein